MEGWDLHPGDPTWSAWFIVLLYGTSAWLVFNLLRSQSTLGARERWFWLGVLIVMVLLGINKQLDLQTVLMNFGKSLMIADVDRTQRKLVKQTLLGGLAVLGVVALALPIWLIRNAPRGAWLAWFGTAVLASFVILRAATFQHLAGGSIAASPVWILEVVGATLVGSAAWLRRSGKNSVRAF